MEKSWELVLSMSGLNANDIWMSDVIGIIGKLDYSLLGVVNCQRWDVYSNKARDKLNSEGFMKP